MVQSAVQIEKIYKKVQRKQRVTQSKTFSVAPMMDCTDRHCRYLHRLISANALLFTEMVTSQAIVHGDQQRLLGFSEQEHPVVLQLGGSDPAQLARAARIGEQFGYGEINLNCGCPSDRVQDGAFGACLMRDPVRVADCVRAIRDAVSIPVSVKHRIGLDKDESYAFVRDFVGEVSQAGCRAFSVHARNAWLSGLSPKENRNVPPLRYAVVHQLKHDFPQLRFFLNGGLSTHQQIHEHLKKLDGAMVGRAAYDTPWMLAEVDAIYRRVGGGTVSRGPVTREAVVHQMHRYARECLARNERGLALRHITRHMLGLCHGLPGARAWRRMLSDANALRDNNPDLILRAYELVRDQLGKPGAAKFS